MYKSTILINLRSMYCSENNSKKAKIEHRFYLMQVIKVTYFRKLNEVRLIKNLP